MTAAVIRSVDDIPEPETTMEGAQYVYTTPVEIRVDLDQVKSLDLIKTGDKKELVIVFRTPECKKPVTIELEQV